MSKKRNGGKNKIYVGNNDQYMRRNSWQPVSELPNCPYCGKKMFIRDITENEKIVRTNVYLKNGKVCQDIQRNYVCQDYPECDTTGRFEYKPDDKSKIRIVSTPANAKLRKMRQEVHYYMNTCTMKGVFKNQKDLGMYLSANMSVVTGGFGAVHVGKMQEYNCKEAFKALIKALYNNRKKYDKFVRFSDSALEDDETRKMLEEISKNIKMECSSYNNKNKLPDIDREFPVYAIHIEDKVRKANHVVYSYDELCETVAGCNYRAKGFKKEIDAWTWLYTLMEKIGDAKCESIYKSTRVVYILEQGEIKEYIVADFEKAIEKGKLVLRKDGKTYIPHKTLFTFLEEAMRFKELYKKESEVK